jgi:hypothetical protein
MAVRPSRNLDVASKTPENESTTRFVRSTLGALFDSSVPVSWLPVRISPVEITPNTIWNVAFGVHMAGLGLAPTRDEPMLTAIGHARIGTSLESHLLRGRFITLVGRSKTTVALATAEARTSGCRDRSLRCRR